MRRVCSKINIVGDTHDVPALKKILSKLDNIFSLGDIVAVNTQEYLKNMSRYSKVWKAYSVGDLSEITDTELNWFHDINIDGWKKQLEIIRISSKSLTVVRGNSDYRMLRLFAEMQESLEDMKIKKPSFRFIERVTYQIFGKVCFVFLPYQDGAYDEIESVISIIRGRFKRIFVLGHCPIYLKHEKEYYVHHFNALKKISASLGKVTYVHGHVHADRTYKYTLPELPNVPIITPKAEDCGEGMGFNHEYLEVDTVTGGIEIKRIDTHAESQFAPLPEAYLIADHWNSYNKPI